MKASLQPSASPLLTAVWRADAQMMESNGSFSDNRSPSLPPSIPLFLLLSSRTFKKQTQLVRNYFSPQFQPPNWIQIESPRSFRVTETGRRCSGCFENAFGSRVSQWMMFSPHVGDPDRLGRRLPETRLLHDCNLEQVGGNCQVMISVGFPASRGAQM